MSSKSKFIKLVVSGAQKALTEKRYIPYYADSLLNFVDELSRKAIVSPKYSKVRDTTAGAIKKLRRESKDPLTYDEIERIAEDGGNTKQLALNHMKYKRRAGLYMLRDSRAFKRMMDDEIEHEKWRQNLQPHIRNAYDAVQKVRQRQQEIVSDKMHKEEMEEIGKTLFGHINKQTRDLETTTFADLVNKFK